MTDTIAQIPPDAARQLDIAVVPAATMVLDGRVLTDGVDLTVGDAFQFLRDNDGPLKTAAISPERFLREFERLSTAGCELVCVTVSQKLSSVFGSAALAAGLLAKSRPGASLKLLDSSSAAAGQGLIVITAAMAAARGAPLEEVVEVVKRAARRTSCLFVVDTLRYACRTGRLPNVVGEAVQAAGVKPILRIGQDGGLHLAGLARNRGKGINRVLDGLKEQMGGVLIDAFVAHCGLMEEAREVERQLRLRLNCRYTFVSEFSPVMALGGGSGILGVAACPVE